MTLVAAAAAGFVGYCLAGWLLGHPVTLGAGVRRVRDARVERRRVWLRQAGAGVTVTQFYAVSGAAGAAALAAVYGLAQTWAVAAVPAALCTTAPQLYYTRRRRRRLAAVTEAWPDGLRELTASLNQQLPLHQALLDLASTGPPALQQAFARYEPTARTLGTVAALERIKEELADPTSDRVMEVLILAAERGAGGNLLARLLGDLTASLTADQRTQQEIATARTEPYIDMVIVAAIPWALLLLIVTALGGPIAAFYAEGRGVVPVLVAAAMTVLGVVITHALAKDPVEPRLFVTPNQEEG